MQRWLTGRANTCCLIRLRFICDARNRDGPINGPSRNGPCLRDAPELTSFFLPLSSVAHNSTGNTIERAPRGCRCLANYQMNTPNDQAADRILKAIECKKLLSPENLNMLTARFAAGRMTTSDWKDLVTAELSTPKSDVIPET